MKYFTETCILLLSTIFMHSGSVHALSYDYSTTKKCLAEPLRAQYKGGIITNPEFNQSIDGWTAFGQANIEERISKGGNKFVVAHTRKHSLDSISQKVQLNKGMLYSFSGWIQISEGSEVVAVIFKGNHGEMSHGGMAIAKHGCWSFLKGGIVATFSGPAEVLFEVRDQVVLLGGLLGVSINFPMSSNAIDTIKTITHCCSLLQCKNIRVEVWADSIALQPFTKQQWRQHQDKSIEKVRKREVELQINSANHTMIKVSINQMKPGFPFGCGINNYILTSTDYQRWFASRFTVTAFTNQMKWYSTEITRGHENYTIPDAMVRFVKKNGILLRGHNILWDRLEQQLSWVKTLSPKELAIETEERIKSIVLRYRGQVIGWDVVNENLHYSFFEDKLGKNASEVYYSKAYHLDPKTTMFMNEFNTIEDSRDEKASPSNYVKKLQEILSFPGNAGIKAGIGLQGHFGSGKPNVAYMRSALDVLATMGLPIWITEVDVEKGPNQAQYLEDILREAYAHPAIKGIVSFSGPLAAGFKVMPLTYMNFTNTPNGDVIDKLIAEWKSGTQEFTVKDGKPFKVSLFHGHYNVTVENLTSKSSTTRILKVMQNSPHETLPVQFDA